MNDYGRNVKYLSYSIIFLNIIQYKIVQKVYGCNKADFNVWVLQNRPKCYTSLDLEEHLQPTSKTEQHAMFWNNVTYLATQIHYIRS